MTGQPEKCSNCRWPMLAVSRAVAESRNTPDMILKDSKFKVTDAEHQLAEFWEELSESVSGTENSDSDNDGQPHRRGRSLQSVPGARICRSILESEWPHQPFEGTTSANR
jgi:hypothetical protein